MQQSQRYGAKTRGGTPCRAPAANGTARCRMHGGAKGSGAPPGNRNALKHGLYSREHLDWRKKMMELLRDARESRNKV